VPDPSCTATGYLTCPTVTALMPQVYLPPNYGAEAAGGNIAGTNVTLNFSNSILNTGSVTAGNTLVVNTPVLTNQQNTTNVGQIWNYIPNTGYQETTGTMAQSGGFMSAANMTLNVQTVNQIGGALQQLNSDGTVNTAASQQLINSLQAQLGGNFSQSTVQNNISTNFIKEGGNSDPMEIVGMIVAAIISIYAGPEVLAAYESVMGPSLAAIALAAGTTGLAASVASQVVVNGGHINWSQALDSAAIAGVTAGLVQGVSVDGSSLSQLAGATPSAGTSVAQAVGTTASSFPEQALAIGAEATIQAGVQTAIEGGSFLGNLETAGINDAAADLSNTIGLANANGDFGTGPAGELAYVAAHGLLGCAASAASGTGCAGGALGAAASAVASPFVVQAVDPTGVALNPAQTAVVAALAALTGSVTAGLAGANAQAGATGGENEGLNNDSKDPAAAVNSANSFETAAKNTLSGVWNGLVGVGEMVANIPNGGPLASPGDPGYISLNGLRVPYTQGDQVGPAVAYVTTVLATDGLAKGGGAEGEAEAQATTAATNTAAVQTAAQNLGVNLKTVTVNSNGVAQVTIGITNSMSFSDVQTLVNYAGSLGATSVEVNSGYLANPKLDGLLQNFAQSGRSLYGGTVTLNPGPSGDYIITFPAGEK